MQPMSSFTTWPIKITGADAGGPRHFPIRASLAARVSQFWNWTMA